ncbi:hypothetical protein Y032_0009g538 [Ancylostoma ceylanicum]|uniref:Uncharacterized protein n=1 Tax=Ancylostoma ceylanicum TaxID=53326 RepID=A0A016VIM6_9BILA|nr:hypothetical protein Y032_0009g538 [Ancylostoma ceylanicum]
MGIATLNVGTSSDHLCKLVAALKHYRKKKRDGPASSRGQRSRLQGSLPRRANNQKLSCHNTAFLRIYHSKNAAFRWAALVLLIVSDNRAALASEGEACLAHRSSPSGQHQLSRRGKQCRLVLLKGAADLTLGCEWKIMYSLFSAPERELASGAEEKVRLHQRRRHR